MKRHPVFVSHVLGFALLWLVHQFLGGYDQSPLGFALFMLGSALSFFDWALSEIAFSLGLAAGGRFWTIATGAASLVIAWLVDRLLFSTRRRLNARS